MIYIQKIFNNKLKLYVYYSAETITATPIISTTSPVTDDLADLIADSHAVVASIDETIGDGEANTATNVGTGSGLFKTKVGADLKFKSILAGTGISLTPVGDDLTIAASGLAIPALSGVKNAVLSENPIGTLVWQKVPAGSLVPTFDIASFAKTAPNGGTLLYRRGETLTGITAAATYVSGPPDILGTGIANSTNPSPQPGDLDPGAWTSGDNFLTASLAGSVKRHGTDFGSDPTMTATLTAVKDDVTDYASFTLQWTRDVYYGVGSSGINSESGIEALTGTLATDKSRTITVSPSSQKVYYAYPKAYGTATFVLNGFPATFTQQPDLTITNVNGVTSTYYVYESLNLLTGTNLNFVVT